MLAALGKPRAKVEVCLDPLLGGISRAMDAGELAQIVKDRPMVDLFLLLVDRDGEAGRRLGLDHLEAALLPKVHKAGGAFLGENAWQEVEVWTIAGHPLLPHWRWNDIRAERDSKEAYFEPSAKTHGLHGEDDGGRKRLSLNAARNYRRIHRLCKEDIQVLHERVKTWLAGGGVMKWSEGLAAL
jgi:hypothetical protein